MTRDKRFIIGGALLALIVVFALLAQLTDYSQLKAFSQQLSGASKHTGLEEDGIANTPAELDGLEPVLGSLTEAEEDGFTCVHPSRNSLHIPY
jgi:alpha-1,4-N-acetylglucosaminyltransferase EXTL3